MSIVTKDDEDAILSRQMFEEKLVQIYHGRLKKPEWTKERINDIIRIIEEYDAALDTKHQRNSAHYYYAKNYDVIEEGGRKCLVQKACKNKNGLDDHQVKIVPVDEYYDVLDMIHRSTGHGGRDKMLNAMKHDVYFIPTSAVVAFVKSCQKCQRGKKIVPSFDTLLYQKSTNRGLVKLIDMQSTPDGRCQWILHYQDYTTKFSLLRPLASNDAAEVASELLKIFLEIGGPAILQIEDDREYTADVIKELSDLWSSCKILNGRPYPSPSAELLENVYKQLTAWMQDNSSSNWAKGLYFVQFQKNCTYHPIIQQTPYKALFGCDPKIGMQTNCPTNFLSTISLEEDLEKELTQKSVTDNQNMVLECTERESIQESVTANQSMVLEITERESIQESVIANQNMVLESTERESIQESVTDIQNKKMDSISCVQKVQYANPYSNVYEEVFVPASNIEGSAVLPEHSVQIKTENITMTGITAEAILKTEDEDKTMTNASIKERRFFNLFIGGPTKQCVTLPLPRAYMIESTSTNKPILCAVCGEKTLPTHSCGSCHKIIHDTCGITFFGSSKLLCPSCHNRTNDNDVVESPEITRSEEAAPAINLERKLTVVRDLRVKGFGYSTVKCRCKKSENQCRGPRCLCRMKKQACINCHNPLDCHNATINNKILMIPAYNSPTAGQMPLPK